MLIIKTFLWQDEDSALLDQAIAMSVGDVNMSEAADEDQDLALGKQSSVVKVYPWQSKFAFSCKKGTTIRIYIYLIPLGVLMKDPCMFLYSMCSSANVNEWGRVK